MPPTTTDNLVLELVAGLKPARPLWRPQTRAAVWLAASLAVVGAEVAYMHGRGLTFTVQAVLPSVAAAFVIGVTCVLAAVASFFGVVPGRETSRLRWLATAAVPVWIALEAWSVLAERAKAPAWSFAAQLAGGEDCALMIGAFAAIPTVLAYLMLRRGAPLSPARCGALALLAGSSMGALGMQLICPSQEAAHLLVWHVLPTLGLGACGFLAGRFMLRW